MQNQELTIGQKKLISLKMPTERNYWEQKLEGAIPSKFFPDSKNISYEKIVEKKQSIDLGLLKKLYDFSKNHSINLSEIFSTAVLHFLYISNNYIDDDFTIQYSECGSVDCFNFPLRSSIGSSNNYLTSLISIKNSISEGKKYADYPTELILEKLPLQIRIISEKTTNETILNDNYLYFIFTKTEFNQWILNIAGNGKSYSIETLNMISERIILLLETYVTNCEKSIEAIDVFTNHDTNIYKELNNTKKTYSNDKTLVDLLESTFKKFEYNDCVFSDDDNLTYKDLEFKAKKVASFLNEKETRKSEIVGVFCERSTNFLVAVFGIILSGRAYLPLDINAPVDRNKTILHQANCNSVITTSDLFIDGYKDAITTYSLEDIRKTSFHYTKPNITQDNLAYIIFTSGSTGTPKGVQIKHQSVINRIQWMQNEFKLENTDVILHKTPSTFDVSVWEIFWWALTGTKVAVLQKNEQGNPSEIIRSIEKFGVTTMHFVPSMLSVFIDYIKSSKSKKNIHSLRRVFCSGEALTPNHVTKFYEELPGVELVNLYGPTEATVDVTWHKTSVVDNPVPIGKPIDNTNIFILDNKRRLNPVGMVGELAIGGVGVGLGYINDQEKTEKSFVDIPELESKKIYLTGDLARVRADGLIEYFGRNDRQVKVRGFRIELGEIESALTKIQGVNDALVLSNAESDNTIHLFAFVISNSSSANFTFLKKELEKSLPKYMIPEKIILLESFPLTSNGKIDRQTLLKIKNERVSEEKIYPNTNEEVTLCKIWEEVLGISNIGINENFFALGGNSINFVSAVALAQEKNLYFTFQDLFKNPTVESLTKNVNLKKENIVNLKENISSFELISKEDRMKVPEYIEDAYPMSMLQSGLVYQSNIMEGENNYHDIVTYTIQGNIDIPTFTEAVKQLVISQPIFRTSYDLKNYSQYMQLVHEKIEKLPLNIYDLRDLSSKQEKNVVYEEWFTTEQHRTFEWAKPGLVQFHIHILSDSEYKYSISQHNSALDGWSMNQVHSFLFTTYFSLLSKTAEKKTLESNNHNRNFISLEQSAIQSKEFQDFWKNFLDEVPSGDIPRRLEEDTTKGNEVIFRDIVLPDKLSDQIISLANQLSVPVKDILLASHVKFLSLLTKANDTFLGYEIGGRPEMVGSETALGVFLNTMPFRVKIDENASWKEFILSVYETEATVLPYRRYPMAKIKQDLSNRDILFETVFNFTHFYSLKEIRDLPGFDTIDVRAAAITEFPLRVEYSRHFYTDAIELSLHYHTSKFSELDISFFGEIFISILKNMVENTYQQQELSIDKVRLNEYSIYPMRKIAKDIKIKNNYVDDETIRISIQKVKKIWSSLLKIAEDDLNLEDDFFLIGGNSLSAMKMALLLEDEVTLKQIMQKSTLLELAEEIASNQNRCESTEVLTTLSKNIESSKNIIFIPYAGGNSVNFIPIAKEIEKNSEDVAIFAAELPAHAPNSVNSQLVNFEQTTKLIVDEICNTMKNKDIYIWGHCVGSALAFEVVRELEKLDIYPKQLFLAAKNMISKDDCQLRISNATSLVFSDIADLYSEWSGEDSLSNLGSNYEGNLVEIFKHDSIQSNTFLRNLWDNNEVKLQSPTSIIIAKDDTITEGYKDLWKNWAMWIENINLFEIESGGHYFLRSNSIEVGKYLDTIFKSV
ncbi:amino acid adenylation domain-containing protein [Enterococcus plantarum]|uniref:non-ribosomal peptide synthetase n=1 Tax=Enterococcus plantarum TaxID=1077675 RepID=UPI001A8C5F7C|nr:non-ribosomal peptide synthetase [Enterococcus plantarum]MBO0468540.1 amino acid adenylation domain-containing protein [Enterococcus plantarum]